MRISTSTFFNNAKSQLQQRRANLSELHSQISSGKRITRLGDDRVSVKKILRDESTLRSNDAAHRIAVDSEVTLDFTEHILSRSVDALQRIRELTVQMSNDSYGFPERAAAIVEITNIKEELVSIANQEINGRRVFSGLGNIDPPFDANGVFFGDNGQMTAPVGETTIKTSLRGGEPFIDPLGGDSVFDAIDKVMAAIGTSDGSIISATLSDIDTASDRLTDGRTEVGRLRSTLESTVTTLDHIKDMTTFSLSKERDADMIDVIMQLREAESGLKAAMAVTSRLEGLSLVDMLR